jgi:hydroxypyruvate reductase
MMASRGRADALACYRAAVGAVEPARLVKEHLTRSGSRLALANGARHEGPVLIVSAGKAGLAMARAAAEVVGDGCVGGVVVIPRGGSPAAPLGFDILEAAHPLPDAASEAAATRVLARVAAADPRTLVLVLLSGGASALLAAPAAGLSLADKQAITAALLGAGADIASVNAVRKHASRIKGGGLARAAAGAAALWTLVLSDVIGDDPATIASGPTVADPTTFADAVRVLSLHLGLEAVPVAVRLHFERGCAGGVPETPKPGDPVFQRAHIEVVGGNRNAVAAAAAAARTLGYVTEVVSEPIAGDAATVGRALAACLRAAPRDRPVALIAGGETTVRVVRGGRGGRCQHLALAAALALEGDAGVLLAAGTDGVDGPTTAAGACVDGGTVARARARGLDPTEALAVTDSHTLLAATGDLVETGPSGTNVADVVVGLSPAVLVALGPPC